MATNINTDTALVQVNTQTTTKTVTLPLALQTGGRLITIKDKFGTASNNPITIQPLGGDTIDGVSGAYTLSNSGAAVSLVSDGVSRWMTLNSPSQPFTGSSISLSTGTVVLSTLGLKDPGTGGLSNLQVSSGMLLLGGNEFGAGQKLFLSTQSLNFYDGFGSNLQVNYLNAVSSVISSLTTSNLFSRFITASSLTGMFFGDGSHLSNVIPPSTSVLQPQFTLFVPSTGTSYTAAPWGEQAVTLSSFQTQKNAVSLLSDGVTLQPNNVEPQPFRISYMVGGNNTTLATLRPTVTMFVSSPAGEVYYPSVENFEGGGGSVTFVENLSNQSYVKFFMRGLSNYTFSNQDAYLYRFSFETAYGTGTDIFSTINLWTNYNRFVSTVDFDTNARISVLTTSNLTVNGPSLFNGDIQNQSNVTTNYSSIATAMHTDYLRVMTAAIIGSNSITMSNNNISSANVTVSSLTLYDQSTMTYKALVISSGSLYLGGVLASAGGGGSGGTGLSTLSSLFVGSSSNQNFIKFWGSIGDYNNTVIAQQSTGSNTTELLFFEGSSIQDQFRFQTTGSVRFETGVSSRNFCNSGQVATPSLFISTGTAIGVFTSAPTHTLDVVGTGRFTTFMSSPAVYAGAFYGGVFFA
jgi:hypothetical protein